jgi:TetR/AcrR family transcriptional regulator, repressor of fatR-cypB operon
MNVHSLLNRRVTEATETKTSNPELPRDKRDRLLAAALDLFESRGFEGVAVPEIAKAAGVAIGTVYRYFATKEALVNSLYRHWKTNYNALVLEAPPPHFSPRQAFSFRWERMMLFARTHPHAMRFLVLHHHAPYLDTDSQALDATDRTAMEAFVAGVQQAAGPLAPAAASALIWGAAAGLLKFASDGRLKLDSGNAADMDDALWRALEQDRSGAGRIHRLE